MGKLVNVTQGGKSFAIDEAQLDEARRQGFHVEGEGEAASRVQGDVNEERFGGTAGQVAAGALGLARGATLGASDVALRAAGIQGSELDTLREVNPTTSLISEFGGALASGGTSLPGGLAAKAGARVAATAEGAGALTQVGRAAAGAGVEGALFGAGQGVSALALSDDPVTLERAASVIGSNALFGAATGAAIGGVGKLAEKGLQRAKSALDKYATKSLEVTANVGDDLAQLDRKGLRSAEKTEIDSLSAQHATDRAAAKSTAVDDVLAYRQQVKDVNPWLVIDEGEHAAQLNKAKNSLRAALNDPKGLRENPASLLKPLRVEEQALEGAIAKSETIATKLEATNGKIAKELGLDLATLPDSATHVELSGKAAKRYGAYADVKVGREAVIQVAREDAQGFLQAIERGEVRGASQKALDNLGGLLEQNRTLQGKIKDATKPLTARAELASPRLEAIQDAMSGLGAATKKEGATAADILTQSAIGHAVGMATGIPYLGQAVLAAKAVGGVWKKLGGETAAAAARGSKAIQTFLDVGAKVAPPARVLATRALSSVRYGLDQEDKKTSKKAQASLPELYKARSSEIRELTAPGPDGAPVMRLEARQKMADRLAPIRAANPLAYDRIETTKARGIEFLAGKLPRKPDLPGMAMAGKHDTWQPSDMEMRGWARYVAAVEDPHGIVERLATGEVTPEDAETMRTVYPQMFAQIQSEIMGQLGELRAKLPYKRRLAMSIFSGVAVDPALDPRVLSVLQGTFAREAGTSGGVQAPRAEPAFGSVSKEKPTHAQERGAE